MSLLYNGARGGTGFADPYVDYASIQLPQSHAHALQLCERIMLIDGTYRAAVDRVLAYFITDLEVVGGGRAEKDAYLDYLHDKIGILAELRVAGLDYMTYGNSFTSIVSPIRKYLACPRSECSYEAPFDRMAKHPDIRLRWTQGEFRGNCPNCRQSVSFRVRERNNAQAEGVRLRRWSPHNMELIWDLYSGDTSYIWKIPDYERQKLQESTPAALFSLARTPQPILDAVQNNQDIEFEPDFLFHMKEETLAGVVNRGWGISRILTNFRQAYYIQVLRRYNEALLMDYLVPMRVITPAPRQGGSHGMGDPLMGLELSAFTSQVQGMLIEHRYDPATWHVLPYPVQYQILGGEATQLAPRELLEQARDDLLTATGVPVEFYRGSMTLQTAPAALRLMESNWNHLTYALNRFLAWLVKRIAQMMSWDALTVRLVKPSHADDLNRQLAKLQLMNAGFVSRTTGLKSIGLDLEEEIERGLEEQELEAEKTQEAQERMQMAGLGDAMASGQLGMPAPGQAQPPAGGAAPPPAAGAPPPQADPVAAILAQIPAPRDAPLSPEDIDALAESAAQSIFALPSSTYQISALRQLKQKNPTVHALTKSKLEGLRQAARRDGQVMAEQAAAAAMPINPMR